MLRNMIWILGDWFAQRAPSEIFLFAFIAGSLLSWFAAREWFTATEEDDEDVERAPQPSLDK